MNLSKIRYWPWYLYDCGNQAWNTCAAFVIAPYFTDFMFSDPSHGPVVWARIGSVSGFIIMLLAPILGAYCDQNQAEKYGLSFFTFIACISTGLIWFAAPHSNIWFIMTCIVLTNVTSELAFVFYNALLPKMCRKEDIGKVSGRGIGIGYLGGIITLSAMYLIINKPELFGVTQQQQAHIRIVGPYACICFALCTIPLIIYTPNFYKKKLQFREAMKKGLGDLYQTFCLARGKKGIILFLIAKMLYNDGIYAMLALVSLYAHEFIGMTIPQIIFFGISCSISAAVGSILFSQFESRIGVQRSIPIYLMFLISFTFMMLSTTQMHTFFLLSICCSLFIGPIQSSSRSFYSQIIPKTESNQLFALYAMTGRITTAIAPLVFSIIGEYTKIWAYRSLLLFVVAGLIFFLCLPQYKKIHY